MSDHVEDLAALLERLGGGKTIVAGVSVGGMIAQGLAALRPDLVHALVLLDTAHKIGTEESWNTRIDKILRDGIGSLADGILQGWFTADYRAESNADYSGYRNMLERSPVDGYVATCAAIRDCDLTESTRALSLPTLIIAGAEDGSTSPDLVRSMANLIKGSRFELIDNAGHLPLIERPEVIAKLIADFANSAG
jgi:3-oxoadipate enol-lactonase